MIDSISRVRRQISHAEEFRTTCVDHPPSGDGAEFPTPVWPGTETSSKEYTGRQTGSFQRSAHRYYPHFTDEATEALGGPTSPSKSETEPGLEPRFVRLQSHIATMQPGFQS